MVPGRSDWPAALAVFGVLAGSILLVAGLMTGSVVAYVVVATLPIWITAGSWSAWRRKR